MTVRSLLVLTLIILAIAVPVAAQDMCSAQPVGPVIISPPSAVNVPLPKGFVWDEANGFSRTTTSLATGVCSDLLLSDSLLFFVDTIGATPPASQTVLVSSNGEQFIFTAVKDTSVHFFDLTVANPTTPGSIEVSAQNAGLPAGVYSQYGYVFGDYTVCDPGIKIFRIQLTVIDTSTNPATDRLQVATVPTVPGARVVVPVYLSNVCDAFAMTATLAEWSEFITFDSMTWDNSRADNLNNQCDSVLDLYDPLGTAEQINICTTFDRLPSDCGAIVDLHFSVAVEAPAGHYPIDLFDENTRPTLTSDCGTGATTETIPFISGGIIVDTSANYVCGYVVDPDGHPIPGATVQLFDNYPQGSPLQQTTTGGSGSFAFQDFTVIPFDLHAFAEGYFPKTEFDLNFGDVGIMIVLEPIPPVAATPEWVNFYCDYSEFGNGPIPVGSVIEAFDADGVLCGTYWVSELGRYGFLPVYADDPYLPGDQGAEVGDTITFLVNGYQVAMTGDRVWTANGDSWQVCLQGGVITQNVYDITPGWNLISWNVNVAHNNITTALSSIEGCYEVALGFEQGGLIYDPMLPQYSTLWEVDNLSGYWINATCSTSLTVEGISIPETTPIPLDAGWNLVSYLPESSMSSSAAFTSLGNQLLYGLGWDNLLKQGQVYYPSASGANTLTETSRGHGYWVKMAASGYLTYPGSGPSAVAPAFVYNTRPASKNNGNATDAVNTSMQWVNLYSPNLTINGTKAITGTIIDAFTEDGDLIGSYTLQKDGQFGFMSVYANDGDVNNNAGLQPGESFYLTVNGTETNERYKWTNSGDRIEVSMLTSKDAVAVLPTSYSLAQNFPNPFNPSTTIQFVLPHNGQAKLEVFNLLGKLVAVPFSEQATAGLHTIDWDGHNSAGLPVASGIYFYRLSSGSYTETKKMMMLK